MIVAKNLLSFDFLKLGSWSLIWDTAAVYVPTVDMANYLFVIFVTFASTSSIIITRSLTPPPKPFNQAETKRIPCDDFPNLQI